MSHGRKAEGGGGGGGRWKRDFARNLSDLALA